MSLNCTRNWKIRKISFVQTNSPFIKLELFLSKVRSQSGRSKGEDAELNSLSNCHKLRWRVWVWTAEETEKYGKFNSCRRIQLSQNKNFPFEKFVLEVDEGKEEMQNWILYPTVTNSDREFLCEPHK